MLDGCACARRLEYLYLGGNRLARVPDAIGALSRLTYLNLSENLLEHVPPALGRLRQLRVLDLVLYCTVLYTIHVANSLLLLNYWMIICTHSGLCFLHT